MPRRRCRKIAQQSVVRAARGAAKARVQPVIILDRVKAPGEAGVVKRVDVDRVEPHRGDARQLRDPVRDRPGQGRKQIIDAQPFRHRPVPCDCTGCHCVSWHNAGKAAAAHKFGLLGRGICRTKATAGLERPKGPIRDRRHPTLQSAIRSLGLLSDALARDRHRSRGIHSAARNWVRQQRRASSALLPRGGKPRRRRQLPFKRRNCHPVPKFRYRLSCPVMPCRAPIRSPPRNS